MHCTLNVGAFTMSTAELIAVSCCPEVYVWSFCFLNPQVKPTVPCGDEFLPKVKHKNTFGDNMTTGSEFKPVTLNGSHHCMMYGLCISANVS